MAEFLGDHVGVRSAGFVDAGVDKFGNFAVNAYGSSDSLDIPSREEDSEAILLLLDPSF